jgi:hypothetical protein
MTLRVLELFSGLGGWGAAFRDRGHTTLTVDNDARFKPNVCRDILTLKATDLAGPWDLILAGPPCQTFSVCSLSRHWRNRQPASREVRHAIRLVRHTLSLIRELQPRAWILENPRAMMRHLPDLMAFERRTVTYCQYGRPIMKPTDLWGHFPPTLRLHAPCQARQPCHEPAPRGSRTGTNGVQGAAQRALIPPALSMAVCMAMENWTEVAA